MGGFAGMRVAAHHPELILNAHSDEHTATREKAVNRIKYGFLAQMNKAVQPRAIHADCRQRALGRTTRLSAARRPMLEQWTGKTACTPAQYCPILAAVVIAASSGRRRWPQSAAPRSSLPAKTTPQAARQFKKVCWPAFAVRGHVNISGAGHISSLETPEP